MSDLQRKLLPFWQVLVWHHALDRLGELQSVIGDQTRVDGDDEEEVESFIKRLHRAVASGAASLERVLQTAGVSGETVIGQLSGPPEQWQGLLRQLDASHQEAAGDGAARQPTLGAPETGTRARTRVRSRAVVPEEPSTAPSRAPADGVSQLVAEAVEQAMQPVIQRLNQQLAVITGAGRTSHAPAVQLDEFLAWAPEYQMYRGPEPNEAAVRAAHKALPVVQDEQGRPVWKALGEVPATATATRAAYGRGGRSSNILDTAARLAQEELGRVLQGTVALRALLDREEDQRPPDATVQHALEAVVTLLADQIGRLGAARKEAAISVCDAREAADMQHRELLITRQDMETVQLGRDWAALSNSSSSSTGGRSGAGRTAPSRTARYRDGRGRGGGWWSRGGGPSGWTGRAPFRGAGGGTTNSSSSIGGGRGGGSPPRSASPGRGASGSGWH